MGNSGCQWVRVRLPLLAGDELPGTERRKVERHLIGCPGCRARQGACEQALTALRSAALGAPGHLEAPSLWPDLARQIRQSRRPAPFSWLFAWPGFRIAPVLAVGTGVLSLVVGLVVTRQEFAKAQAQIASGTRPLVSPSRSEALHPVPQLVRTSQPAPNREPSRPAVETTVAENTPPRVDYHLDRGTPMPTEPRDSNAKQPSY